jgi:PAS domain-containing protein
VPMSRVSFLMAVLIGLAGPAGGQMSEPMVVPNPEDSAKEDVKLGRTQIVEGIPTLVAVMTPTGEVELVNRLALEYFGRTIEEGGRARSGSMSTPPYDHTAALSAG